jgi:hypothetical protein
MLNIKSALRAGVMASALLCAMANSASAEANFEGVWKIVSPTGVLKPLNGSTPFTAAGRKAYNENKKLQAKKQYDDYDITTSRCSNPGVPRLSITPLRFKIWQRQKMVTFDFEFNRDIRQIDVHGVPVPAPLVPTMTGVSIGKWEGDILVATTTEVSERTLIDDLTPHTAGMKVTERWRLVDKDTLENRMTIEDAAYFTKPWDAVVTYKRQPDALFPEDVCMDRLEHQKNLVPR